MTQKALRKVLLSMLMIVGSFAGLKSQTASGTDFWCSATYPFYASDTFLVAVSSEKPTKAYLEVPRMNYKDSMSLGYNEIKFFKVPQSIRYSYYYYSGWTNNVGENAIHVTSKLPVRVYAFSGGTYYSCGATAVYPTSALPPGASYRPYKSRYSWNGGLSTYKVFFFTVVAIDDTVTVKFKSSHSLLNLPPGNTIKLYKGQIARFYAYIFMSDPTLEVYADVGKRIAVFSENFYDVSQDNCWNYDLMFEEMLPENLLGSEYIVTPFHFHKKGYEYVVTAVDSNTTVKRDNKTLVKLNKGETYYGMIYGDTSSLISSDKPLNCWERNISDTCFSSGWWWNYFSGPSLMTISTSDQFIQDAVVTVPENSNFNLHYINIITTKFGKDSCWMDGTLIPPSDFKSILGGSYYLYRDTIEKGNHRLINNYGFISYLYGRGQYGAYAYNASSGLQSLKRFVEYKVYSSCDTGRIVKLTSEGDPSYNFQWTFGNMKDTGKTVYFQVPAEGTYPYKLRYQLQRNGRWDSLYGYIQVKGTEKLDFIAGKTHNICNTSYKFTLPKTRLFKYKWNTGDTTNEIKITSSGQYTVKVTDVDAKCYFYDTANVNLFNKMAVDFSVAIKKQCPGYPVYLTNTTTAGAGDSLKHYSWYVDKQPAGNYKNDTVPYAYPGTYDFKLIVNSKNGCTDSVSKQLKIQDRPVLVTGLRTFDSCYQRSNYRFNSRSSLSVGKIVRYQWLFDDGDTTYKNVQAIRNIRDSGVHWYRFAAYSDYGCADTSPKKYYKVYSAPSPVLKIQDSSVCKVGNYFDFANASITHGQKVKYEWQWGDGTGETFEDPNNKHYDDTGTYMVQLVAAYVSTGCSDTARYRVRVVNSPKAIAVRDSASFCLKQNYVHVTSKSTASSGVPITNNWKWDDGKFSYNKNSDLHKYDKAGTYRIWLYSSAGKGCSDSVRILTTVYNSSLARIGITDSNICGPNNFVNLKNNSLNTLSSTKYLWRYGDGNTSTLKDPGKVNYAAQDTYRIALEVFDPLYPCRDTAYRTIILVSKPTVSILKSDTAVCLTKDTFTFTDKTPVVNAKHQRTWYFDGKATDTSSLKIVKKLFSSVGKHNVWLRTGEFGVCEDTQRFSVDIRYPDSVGIIQKSINYACEKGNLNLSYKTTYTGWTYEWEVDGNKFTTAALNKQQVNGTGNKKILLTVTDANKCAFKHADSLNILPAPKVTITNNTLDAQCFRYNNFTFKAGITNGTNPISYSWKWNAATAGTSIDSLKVKATATGQQKVTLKIKDANGCIDSTEYLANIYDNPKISYTLPDLCEGKSFEVTGTASPAGIVISNWQWFEDALPPVTGNPYKVNYTTVGTHTLYAIATTADNCKDTGIVENYEVYPTPVAAFEAELQKSTSQGIPVQFTDKSTGAVKYKWYPEPSVTLNKQNPLYYYQVQGLFTVVLEVENAQGCTDTAQMKVKVKSDEDFFVPSSFTPNNDNVNETFGPAQISAVKAYRMVIYNRWGAKLFETNEPSVHWDGKYKGAYVNDGSYVYRIDGTFVTGRRFVYSGEVTLIR